MGLFKILLCFPYIWVWKGPPSLQYKACISGLFGTDLQGLLAISTTRNELQSGQAGGANASMWCSIKNLKQLQEETVVLKAKLNKAQCDLAASNATCEQLMKGKGDADAHKDTSANMCKSMLHAVEVLQAPPTKSKKDKWGIALAATVVMMRPVTVRCVVALMMMLAGRLKTVMLRGLSMFSLAKRWTRNTHVMPKQNCAVGNHPPHLMMAVFFHVVVTTVTTLPVVLTSPRGRQLRQMCMFPTHSCNMMMMTVPQPTWQL